MEKSIYIFLILTLSLVVGCATIATDDDGNKLYYSFPDIVGVETSSGRTISEGDILGD